MTNINCQGSSSVLIRNKKMLFAWHHLILILWQNKSRRKCSWGGRGRGGWREGRSINTTISFSVISFYFSFYWFSLILSVFIRFSTLFYPKGFKIFSLFFYFSLTIKLSGKIGQTSSYLYHNDTIIANPAHFLCSRKNWFAKNSLE